MAELAQKVNIVIPVLNGGAYFSRLLEQVSGFEVIVVDGGSSDGSADIARKAACVVVETEPSRGAQLAKGAGQTSLEWLLFLHADSCLSPNWQEAASAFIENNSHSLAVFRFKLDDESWRARTLERLVGLRGRLFGLPYGDQGLLIHRSAYLKAGGFQAQGLMEDVALIKKFNRKEICHLDCPLITSAEKFRKHGYLRQSTKNLFLLLLYFVGVSPKTLERLYR